LSWKAAHLRAGADRGKVAAKARDLLVDAAMTPTERISGRSPSAADIDAIARRTLQRLPSPFAESLGDVVLVIEEVADPDTARRLGLSHPMNLSGLYEGIPLNQRSVSESGTLPERITLYRRPILAEWRSTGVSLDQLVAHIVIHEVGHHFGFSDDDMHTLEREAE
jgi:predicted Zn-dependent protease with MMP-like domain